MIVRVRLATIQLPEENAYRTSELKDSGNPPCKGVFYHTSRLKTVFSYVCLGRTLLFEFILATQFFVHQIMQVLRKFSFPPRHH